MIQEDVVSVQVHTQNGSTLSEMQKEPTTTFVIPARINIGVDTCMVADLAILPSNIKFFFCLVKMSGNCNYNNWTWSRL